MKSTTKKLCHLYACPEVPYKLIVAMMNVIGNGNTTESLIKDNVEHLRKNIVYVRSMIPTAKMHEWYLMALTMMDHEKIVMSALRHELMNTWQTFQFVNSDESRLSRKIWKEFEKSGGKIK